MAKKPTFYKCVLVEVEPIQHAYAKKPKVLASTTLDDRLPNGECDECGGNEWYFIPTKAKPNETKPYICCMDCGYITHL